MSSGIPAQGVLVLILVVSSTGPAQDDGKPPSRPAVYYADNEEFKNRVRLSDEMTAKVVQILRGKPNPFERTILTAPRGYFSVDGKTYPYYGFLTSHPAKGDSWDDPVLRRFWEELNRVGYKVGLDPIKDFKP
jgi:hypothetical protein